MINIEVPTVSVCMITYNHKNYINQAIESVLMQKTNFIVELVIGEDCSMDGTREICIEYKNKYPNRINLLLRSENLGMTPNALETKKACHGKYIAILEGDDYWTDPYKLQKQVDFLEENPDYTFSMGRVDMLIEKTGRIVKRKEHVNPLMTETYSIKDYLKAPFSQTSSFVYRNSNELLPDWFANVYAGDQSLVIIKTGKNGKIKYHKELFSIYRLNNSSISHTISYNVYEKFSETLKDWQNYLGEDYKAIFKIISYKNKQRAKQLECRYLLCKVFYFAKIKIIDFFLKFF